MQKKEIKNTDEKGAIFIPILIFGGKLLLVGAAGFLAYKGLSAYGKDVMEGTLHAFGDMIYGLAKVFFTLVMSIFDSATKVLDWPITTNSAFVTGWSSVRDLSNMLIVLGFVIVGIATTLRLREYEAKKLLLPLVVVALLLNFSGLFCGIAIDASNITMNTLLQKGGGSSMSTWIESSVLNSANQRFGVQNDPIYSDPVLYFEICAMYALIWIFVAITFFYLAFIFVARYAILTFLYVLSPLAFVCKVFPIPAAQKIWSSWWENFIKWSFIGIEGAFFLWLSASLLLSKINESSALQVPDLLVIILFLFIGIKFTTKTSAMGASAVIGMAGGAAGFAMGATKVAGKGAFGVADKITGNRLSGAGHAVAGGAMRIGEKLGIVREGAAASAQQKRRDDAKKTMEALRNSSYAGDRAKYESYVRKGGGIKGASAVALANENKEFGKIMKNDLGQMQARASYSQQFGFRADDFEKKMPSHAANNTASIKRLMGEMNPITGANYTASDAAVEVVRQKFAGMNTPDIQDLHHSHITAAGTAAMNSRAFDRASLNFNADQSSAYKALLPNLTTARTTLAAQVFAAPVGVRRNTLQRRLDNFDRIITIINNPGF